ncbi:MAG: septum site-determining protein MinC [Pseudomonadota bacterium]
MSEAVMENPTCFQLKTSFSACTILQLNHYDLDQLAAQIPAAVQKAPNFFLGSPVVIDLEQVAGLGTLDFKRIKQILLTNNLVPVGVRGGNEEQLLDAVTAGIPRITVGFGKAPKAEPKSEPETTTNEIPQPIKDTMITSSTFSSAKIVTSAIRSGMSVYAKDADLIILASVSSGAEILADGNIHVYGQLRGRALAGVQGDTQARIFCRSLEAELVAIAGYYLVKEEMQNFFADEATVQVYLENEQIKIVAV